MYFFIKDLILLGFKLYIILDEIFYMIGMILYKIFNFIFTLQGNENFNFNSHIYVCIIVLNY